MELVVWLWLLVVGLVLVLGLVVYFWLLARFLDAGFIGDEIHFVEVEDGARLAVYRHRPKGGSCVGIPVLMCHGLGACRYNLDLDRRYSWAYHLSRVGFDVWVLDLRGNNFSLSPRGWDWDFDDHLLDVRAVVDYVLACTGSTRVHWVGHSMGGLLLYAYLSVYGDSKIGAGVALGSPCCFSTPRDYRVGLWFAWLLDWLPMVPLALVVRLLIPYVFLLRWLPGWVIRCVPKGVLPLNPSNVELSDLRWIAYNVVRSTSSRLFQQFAMWVRSGRFCSFDGGVDYRENLDRVELPLLIFSGSVDRVARRRYVEHALDLFVRARLTYIELGRSCGFREDYGHGDMVFGRYALEEVFPLVRGFLERYSVG